MMSLSGHKIYGPKGSGVLFVRRGVVLDPLISGGGQERQRRSGTENVASIVGLGEALILSESERLSNRSRMQRLSNRLVKGIIEKIPDAITVSYTHLRAHETCRNVESRHLL